MDLYVLPRGCEYATLPQDADGKPVDMAQYKGKVVLIINVASACGYTPQYKDMATLYDKYKSQGLVILGFPCNQFGGQEPGRQPCHRTASSHLPLNTQSLNI